MLTASIPRLAFVAALLAIHGLPQHALPQEATRPAAIDNLRHAAGTATGPAGIAHVTRGGTGPVTLLLIAGAPFGEHAWEGFLARNAERYRMVAVTPAGYEGTRPPAMPDAEHEDYSERPWTEALMNDLVALIEKEQLAPVIVVGHHLMGDYYAVRLACEHPELVRGVVAAAGLGSFPIGPDAQSDPEKRAAFVGTSRVPFFRGVSQETWNAGTFPAGSLSKDPARGAALYQAEVAVPIPTQLRYYLEYMTDELESRMEFVQAPVLSLTLPSSFTFDSISPSMRDQLIKRFGTLEEARKQTRFGTPWDGLASRGKPGQIELREIPGAGIFLMDDAPEAFDGAVAEFVARLAPPAATALPKHE